MCNIWGEKDKTAAFCVFVFFPERCVLSVPERVLLPAAENTAVADVMHSAFSEELRWVLMNDDRRCCLNYSGVVFYCPCLCFFMTL